MAPQKKQKTTDIAALEAALHKKFGATRARVVHCRCYDRYFYDYDGGVRWSEFARLATRYGAIALEMPRGDRLVLDVPVATPRAHPDEIEFWEDFASKKQKGAMPVALGYDGAKMAVYDWARLGNVLVCCGKFTYPEVLIAGSLLPDKNNMILIGNEHSSYSTAYSMCQNLQGPITDTTADAVSAICALNGYVRYRASLPRKARASLPHVMVLIDSLSQIIAADKRVMRALRSILQRSADVHMHIVCFDRDMCEKVSPNLRANFETKIVFQTPNAAISKKILGVPGAELLGQDDMLLARGPLPLVHIEMPDMM